MSGNSLVASRNPEWRLACATRLLNLGLDVHTATNAARAIELLRKHSYAAVAIDDSIDDMNLVEFLPYVMELASRQTQIYVGTCGDRHIDRVCAHYAISHRGTPAEIISAIQRIMPA